MTNKLSKRQAEVLSHMTQGHKLCCATHVTPWLDGMSSKAGKRVHGNVLLALLRRGYIERADTDKTPWWRRDYVITDRGREKLAETKEESDNASS